MINIQTNALKIVLALAAVFAVTLITTQPAHAAQEDQAQTSSTSTQQASPASEYSYTAQPGDSYSLFARKAIQTYGLINNVQLTQAEIIAAETNLTQELGSLQVNNGAKVAIKTDLVKKWIETAQKLTPEQKTAWQAYTVGVDFNTNSVGEVR